MAYLFNTPEDQRAMLESIGVESVSELFDVIPESVRLRRPLQLPPAMGELELTGYLSRLAAENLDAERVACFLGAGSYDHFVPAVVDSLASRGEFYTSYTPYQPEVSQGNLQAMFEYQTVICQLTGMDVSNASLYDGGSATAEAVLMAMSATRRQGRVLVADSLHPEYRQILDTYLTHQATTVEAIPSSMGTIDLQSLAASLDAGGSPHPAACVVIQYPNFFGCIERLEAIAQVVHQAGALLVVVCDPISLGILQRPGQLGADIVVAEGHTLGTPMSYGGPYLGILACREQFVRRLPGRIAGQTVDRRGRRCWVLTLQTREQHIRRDKATSNICTNQGLFALRATIYLAAMGPQGMRDVAELCVQKSHYAAERISADPNCELLFHAPFVKEFVVRIRSGSVSQVVAEAQRHNILAGVPLGRWFPHWNDCLLIAVTEKRTRSEIDALAAILGGQRGLAAEPKASTGCS